MKIYSQILFSFIFVFLFSSALHSQTGSWMQITSDNSDFSAEVPTNYDFYYDETGFVVSDGTSSHKLKKMHLYSAFVENTLISFECYEAGKGGFETTIDIDKSKYEVSETEEKSVKIKQIVEKTSDYLLVRKYFRAKDFFYIVTAASRKGETPAMKRFLDSIIFNANSSAPNKPKFNFPDLKISKLEIEVKEDLKYTIPKDTKPAAPKDPNITPVQVILKPRASYIDNARMAGVQGSLAFRVDLNERGVISKVVVIKPLPEGLTRQALFAALRFRFLPSENRGIPQKVSKAVEYRFSLY